MTIKYTAESLNQIAAEFRRRANDSTERARHLNYSLAAPFIVEAAAWNEAAAILDDTTISPKE